MTHSLYKITNLFNSFTNSQYTDIKFVQIKSLSFRIMCLCIPVGACIFSHKLKLSFYGFCLRRFEAKSIIKSSISEIAAIEFHSRLGVDIINSMTFNQIQMHVFVEINKIITYCISIPMYLMHTRTHRIKLVTLFCV